MIPVTAAPNLHAMSRAGRGVLGFSIGGPLVTRHALAFWRRVSRAVREGSRRRW